MQTQMKRNASLSIVEDTKMHRFLMIKHQRGINKGHLNFPGGKQEAGETMEECVIRETKEETGLDIKNPLLVGYIEFPGADLAVYVYRSTEYSGTLHEKQDEVIISLMSRCVMPTEIFYLRFWPESMSKDAMSMMKTDMLKKKQS